MKNMYLITRHDFDVYENEIGNALYAEIIGVVADELSAIKYINENSQKLDKYKGWDGTEYPYYTKQYVEVLQ